MLPVLYDALCSILKSTILPQSLRADIYLTFGYLYYPEDLYPEEELGPLGFLDDLMLILVVLRKCAIKEKIGIEFIEEHITGLDYSVNQLLTSDFDTITNENKNYLMNYCPLLACVITIAELFLVCLAIQTSREAL